MSACLITYVNVVFTAYFAYFLNLAVVSIQKHVQKQIKGHMIDPVFFAHKRVVS